MRVGSPSGKGRSGSGGFEKMYEVELGTQEECKLKKSVSSCRKLSTRNLEFRKILRGNAVCVGYFGKQETLWSLRLLRKTRTFGRELLWEPRKSEELAQLWSSSVLAKHEIIRFSGFRGQAR